MAAFDVDRFPAVKDVRDRFGIRIREHRIGELRLRVAEVDRVDEMVEAVYPEAVTLHGDAPVWMITWPSALALAEHAVAAVGRLHAAAGRPVRVLELGCGTAAPGIAAAMAGASVVATDHDELALEVARCNAGLNGCAGFEATRLDWFHPDLEGRFDLILGSEVVYFELAFEALAQVLGRYAEPGGCIVLADPGRAQMDGFLRLCEGRGMRPCVRWMAVHLPESSHRIRLTTIAPPP